VEQLQEYWGNCGEEQMAHNLERGEISILRNLGMRVREVRARHPWLA
jgi:hypothetical protein